MARHRSWIPGPWLWLAKKIGWGPTIGVFAVAWVLVSQMPHTPRPYTGPSTRPRHHGTPGPGAIWLEARLEELRLWGKETFYDPALARAQARRQARRQARGQRPPVAYAPVVPDPVRVTLGPKRIRAAKGDAAVPPHPRYDALADYKRYGISAGGDAPESTSVFYLMGIEPVADRPIRAILGKAVLRDAAGQALFVQQWHFPVADPGTLAAGRGPLWATLADLRRRDGHPRFDAILATPAAHVRLEWTTYFVCYADGAMAGDAHAARGGLDGEGLPVIGFANGLPWLVHQQYPAEAPGATLDMVYPD